VAGCGLTGQRPGFTSLSNQHPSNSTMHLSARQKCNHQMPPLFGRPPCSRLRKLEGLKSDGKNAGSNFSRADLLLRTAIEKKSPPMAEAALRLGANINASLWEEGTRQRPLHVACNLGDEAMVQLLLKWGCNVNASNALGWSPLHYAVSAGHLGIVHLLLARSAWPAYRDNAMRTPLHILCSKAAHAWVVHGMLLLLLEAGGQKLLSAKCESGQTPLDVAAFCGNVEAVRLLVLAGANVEALSPAPAGKSHKAILLEQNGTKLAWLPSVSESQRQEILNHLRESSSSARAPRGISALRAASVMPRVECNPENTQATSRGNSCAKAFLNPSLRIATMPVWTIAAAAAV
jgi:ankyrin repeat protein